MAHLLSVSLIERGRHEPSSHLLVAQCAPVIVAHPTRSIGRPTRACGVVRENPICRRPMAILQFKARPARRDAWLKTKCFASQLKTQNRFDGDAVEPTRRARVPRPTAAARVRWGAIHIGTNYIRLNFVMLHLLSRRGMVDGVD